MKKYRIVDLTVCRLKAVVWLKQSFCGRKDFHLWCMTIWPPTAGQDAPPPPPPYDSQEFLFL